jgi:hypothetical protein
MTTRLLAALAVSAAVALAGCGGSSSAGSHDFVRQLDTLCTAANHAFSSASTSQAQSGVVMHFLTKAHSLNAPANLRSLYSRYLAVLGSELHALEHGNSTAVQDMAQKLARPLATRLGAGACANPR